MKKTTLLIVLASLLATSCLKDGFKDFDALQHGMTFHGTVNPVLGVPIGTGSVTIYDMLQMVQISYATMEVDSRGIITITYDTAASWFIDLQSAKKEKAVNKGATKDPTIVHVARNSIEGSVAIDLFENLTFLDTVDIEIDSLLVYLKAYIKADADDSAIHAMENYHVHVYYDQLYIDVLGQDNSLHRVYPGPNDSQDSIPIDSLIAGQYLTFFNNTDISEAINHRPKEIRYGARMNIAFEAAFFAMNLSENEFVADSIGVRGVNISGNVKVRFPVSAYLNNLRYNTDIAFTPSFRLGDLKIDSSMLYIDCQNGIPLSLLVRAQFVDVNDQVLCDILDPVETVVEGANVELNPNTNLYTSVAPKETLIQIPITQTVFDALLQTRKIRIGAGLNTSPTGNALRKRVSIQATDKLDLRVWAKLHPTYDIDFDLGGSGNGSDTTSNNGKGGVK